MFIKEGDAAAGPKLLPAAAKKLQASGKKPAPLSAGPGGKEAKFAQGPGGKVLEYHKQAEFGAKKFIKP